MKQLGRILALTLVLCMALSMLPATAVAATVSSGTCGENLSWTLSEDGTLTITGTGAMDNDTMWKSNKSSIVTVVLSNGVTGIGSYAFSNCINLRGVLIPTSVKTIGYGAFAGCNKLNAVFYCGTQSQKNSISVSNNNANLTNTQWHYEITVSTLGSQLAYHCGNCDLYYCPDGFGAEFADVSKSSWQIKSVNYACVRGLMAGKGTDGNGKTIFDPNKPISREEFVQVLYNAEGKPVVSISNRFPDVKNTWYTSAVLWADYNSIASGMGNGNFGIGKNITRQDLAMIFYKYANMKKYDLTTNAGEIGKYADGNKVSGYAKTAMDWAVTKGVLSGKGEKGKPLSTYNLDPAGTATRAECAAMLKNFMTAFDTEITECTHQSLTATAAKSASCMENGNIAYWQCNNCQKYFSDAYGAVEISINEITIQATGHSYSALWSSDDLYHWHAATCAHTSEISSKQKHTLNANNVCTVCQRTVVETYYTITYMNLKGAQSPTLTHYAESVGVATLPSISVTGYNFVGWYTAENGGERITSIAAGNSRDYVLWARWEAIEYEITYSCGRGQNSPDNITKYTVEDTVHLADAILQNYTFAGWYDASGNPVSEIKKGTTGNIKLTAAWKTNRNQAHPIAEITDPIYEREMFVSQDDEFTFIYYLGYIEKVPFGWIGQPYDHQGITDHTVQYSTSESTANSISKTTETATTNTRGWQTEVSATSTVEAECPGFAKASLSVAISNNQSGSTERTSTDGRTVTFSQEYVSSFTSTDTIAKDSPVGWYRYVNYATVDVFATITYNAADNKYYISNVNVVRDITSGWDYSFKSAAFDDVADSTLPFNRFGEVEAFVADLTEGTEGLVYSLGENKSYASVIGYDGDAKDVVIPAYYITTDGNRVPVTEINRGTSENNGVFANQDITSVKIGANIKTVPRYAFYNCKNLTTVEATSNLTTIDDYAFYGCKSLNYNIPKNITTIGDYSFAGCEALDEVTIGETVTRLGLGTFTDCGDLDLTVYPANRHVLNFLTNTNATNITIDLAKYKEDYFSHRFDVVIPDTVSSFRIEGKNDQILYNMNIESYADSTIIRNIELGGMRLKIHSADVQFSSVNLSNSDNVPAVEFCNENTTLLVSNEVRIVSSSHNYQSGHGVVCKNLTVQSVKGVSANVHISGSYGTEPGNGILSTGDVSFSGYINVVVAGGRGQDAPDAETVGYNGATAINANTVTVNITGSFEVYGGGGGEGYDATAYSGQNGTDGSDAGNGGHGIDCQELNVVKATVLTVRGGSGGQGGNGLAGKTGVVMLTSENYKNGGDGGNAGDGGDGGHAFTGIIKIENADVVEVCGGQGGRGGRGGDGGNGGTSSVYFVKEPAGFYGGDAGDGGDGGNGGNGLTPGAFGWQGSSGNVGKGTSHVFGVFGGYTAKGDDGDPGTSGDTGNEGKTLTISE